MNAWWGYFLPAFCAGLVFGVIAGAAAFRAKIVRPKDRPAEPDLIDQPRHRRRAFLGAGAALSIAAAAVWHGPLGAADRFAVKIDWKTSDGKSSGVAAPIKYTPDSGLFWFFGPDNIEVLLKVLNACSLNDEYWVFAGGLTNVHVLITVTDSITGAFVSTTNGRETACDLFPARSFTVAVKVCDPSVSGGFSCSTPVAEFEPGAINVETSEPSSVTVKEFGSTPEVVSEYAIVTVGVLLLVRAEGAWNASVGGVVSTVNCE